MKDENYVPLDDPNDDEWDEDDEDDPEEELSGIPNWLKVLALAIMFMAGTGIAGWIQNRITRFDPKDGVVVRVVTIEAFDSHGLPVAEVRLSKSNVLVQAVPLEPLEAGKYVEVIRLRNQEEFNDDDTGLGEIFVARAKTPK